MSKVFNNNINSKVDVETAILNNSTFNVEGTLEFNDLDVLPGHKTVSGIKVTATGNNELVPYNLVWLGTNTLNTPLNFTVYKVSSPVDVTASCEHKQGKVNGDTIVYEECQINNLDKLGSSISNGTINNNSTKEIIASDEFILASPTGEEIYYYVILEYPNLDESQNIDMGGRFDGKVTVEKSDAQPDITILAAYIQGEDGTYTETKDIPTTGYTINTERSICSNNAKPSSYDGKLLIDNLTKTGTSCNLYYDLKVSALDTIIGDTTSKTEKTSFTGIATESDTGVYSAPDDYGTSYYFRGLEGSLNNWVKFAGSYWRIIRINGNGTVRMIYQGVANGAVSSSNKTGVTTQIGTSAYNHTKNDNAYVGYMMGIPLNGTDATTSNTTSTNSTSYEQAHTNTYNSDAKQTIDSWYANNIANNADYAKHVDTNTGFCNDRQIDKAVNSSYQGNGFGMQNSGYAPAGRLYQNGWKTTQTPTLQCANKERDLFTVNNTNTENKGNKKLTYPVGMLTSDEAIFGGVFGGKDNSAYYLYTNQHYWTMSPHCYGGGASVFYISLNGNLANTGAYSTYGLRPVINLRADTRFIGDGSETSPFEVVS